MDVKDGGITNLLEDILAGPEKFAASRSAMGSAQDNNRPVDDMTGRLLLLLLLWLLLLLLLLCRHRQRYLPSLSPSTPPPF